MPAGIYNIIIEQGSKFDRTLTWRDENGALVDLTNYTAQAQGRTEQENATALFDISTGGNGITLGGAAGTIRLELTAAETLAIEAQSGVWDLQMTESGGDPERLLEGRILVTRGVTR